MRTLTLTIILTHTISAYSVSGNVIRVRILICATRQKPCRKEFIDVRLSHLNKDYLLTYLPIYSCTPDSVSNRVLRGRAVRIASSSCLVVRRH